MKKNNFKNTIIGVLGTLILITTVLIILSMNGTIGFARNANYYLSISGMYSTLEKLTIDGEDKDVSFTLYLLDDGTFKYEYSAYAPVGVIGNYIIDNDTIILNYMFNTNSGTDLYVTKGTKKLFITDDKKIIDNDYEYKDDNKNIDSIKLSYKDDINSNLNINNILKNSLEKDNTINDSITQGEVKLNKIIEKYLGGWFLGFDNINAKYTNVNIKKSKSSKTGYTIDIFINKEADYKNLELICADNSGVCYATGDENHHFSIVMANELVTIVPDYSVQGTAWNFGTKQQ